MTNVLLSFNITNESGFDGFYTKTVWRMISQK